MIHRATVVESYVLSLIMVRETCHIVSKNVSNNEGGKQMRLITFETRQTMNVVD